MTIFFEATRTLPDETNPAPDRAPLQEGRPALPGGRRRPKACSKLTGRTDDLPDHVEPEHEGEAETDHAEPAEIVDANEHGGGDQERRDDDRGADAVGDRAQVPLELAEAGRLHADRQRASLELGDEVAEPTRHPRQRIELRVDVGEELV